MSEENKNKPGMIVLLIFLLICSGLGIAAFTMSFTKKCGEGFDKDVNINCDKDDIVCNNTLLTNIINKDNKTDYDRMHGGNMKKKESCKLCKTYVKDTKKVSCHGYNTDYYC